MSGSWTLEQRRQTRSEYRNIRELRSVRDQSPGHRFELREVPNGTGGSDLIFTGYACVTDHEYEMEDMFGPFKETVSRGAFGKTLAGGADVAFLVNHEGMTLARTKPGTLTLSEDANGLHTRARLDATNPMVISVRSAIDRGDLDEMSFAFRVVRQEWNADYDERWIREVNMDKGDTSIVNYGANPWTGGSVSINPGGMAGAIGQLQKSVSASELRERANELSRLIEANRASEKVMFTNLRQRGSKP